MNLIMDACCGYKLNMCIENKQDRSGVWISAEDEIMI